MFTLNVAFGQIAWVLAFNSEDGAKDAVKKLMSLPPPTMVGIQTTGTDIEIADDFGQAISCKTAPTAILYEDVERSKVLQVDYRIHQARIQSEFQKRAEHDPALRATRGPSVLSPMTPMMRPGNGGI